MWNPETAYQNGDVAEAYDRARFTSWSGRRGASKERRAFLGALAAMMPNASALDVPCGTGRMTEILAERRFRVVGADVSLPMMEEARRKLRRDGHVVRLLRANLLALPFAAGSFDVVTCVRLFGHYPTATRIEMLREMARVASTCVVVQYFYETPVTRFKRWTRRRVLHTYPGVTHPVTDDVLRRELAAAGFSRCERFWCRRYYSEEVFVLAWKASERAAH